MARLVAAGLILLGVSTLAMPPASSAHAQAAPAGRPTAALVRLPFPRDDGSLTPYTFVLGYSLMTLVYDTLLWRDSQGIPQPWLARSVVVSAGATRVTVGLAPGIRWQDGAALTAADVVFTFSFMAAHPHPRFTPELEAIERVSAPDASTVVFSLRHPSLGFVDQPLADVPILPAHLWRGLAPGKVAPDGPAVGSGPYRLDYDPAKSYHFRANNDYFRGPPAVAAIDVPIITSAEQTVRALEHRQVDVLPEGLPPATVERVRGGTSPLSAGPGIDIRTGPAYEATVLLFNTRAPPFDRADVRDALALALDLGRIARNAGAASEDDVTSLDPVPADHGYLHPASPSSSSGVLHGFDEAKARLALAPLHLAALTVLAPDDDLAAAAAAQVALAWQRVGVAATVKRVPAAALSGALGENGAPVSFAVAVSSEPALISYDPDFLAREYGSGGALNVTGYRNPGFDALAARVAAAPDPGARQAAIGEELRLLADDAPSVPLFFAAGAFAYRPAIFDGWVFVKGTGIVDKRSFVEPSALHDAAVAVTAPLAASPLPAPSGRGGLPLGWLALAAFGLAGLLAAVAVRRRA